MREGSCRARGKCRLQALRWPADKVERRSRSTALIPYARNARTHSDEQVAQIAASIREWGWTNPVLVDEDSGIIAGHGRVMAAQKLGIAEVPVMVAERLDRGAAQAPTCSPTISWRSTPAGIRPALDRAGGPAGWGFDIDLTASPTWSSLLLRQDPGLTDPDEVPEPPPIRLRVPGDVWLFGKHRIVCGDSTDADCVAKALERRRRRT
jgi:hypothetical protein